MKEAERREVAVFLALMMDEGAPDREYRQPLGAGKAGRNPRRKQLC